MNFDSREAEREKIKMKEFKFDVDGDGIAIPVIRCETQREFNRTVASYRTDGKLSTNDPDGEVIYIIYKDGSTFYHNSADVSLNEGKYKRTGILRGVSSNPDGYEVFGDFAIDEYGNIVIDEKSIEEYGVYAGQYDVKEQEVQEVSETETNETTDETETEETVEQAAEQEATETVEGISKTETTTGTGNSGFEYYSVKVAYEVIKDEIRSALFTSYSLALKVAEDFTDMWDGDKAIVTAVSLIIRNDRQPESERDKRVLETETAEIERRCVPYHDLGLSGYVSIEDRQDIA